MAFSDCKMNNDYLHYLYYLEKCIKVRSHFGKISLAKKGLLSNTVEMNEAHKSHFQTKHPSVGQRENFALK